MTAEIGKVEVVAQSTLHIRALRNGRKAREKDLVHPLLVAIVIKNIQQMLKMKMITDVCVSAHRGSEGPMMVSLPNTSRGRSPRTKEDNSPHDSD